MDLERRISQVGPPKNENMSARWLQPPREERHRATFAISAIVAQLVACATRGWVRRCARLAQGGNLQGKYVNAGVFWTSFQETRRREPPSHRRGEIK
jgi:hypothetical protein